ncbi:Glycosyl transferases group 1 [Planctomycetes bacterium Pla163]|uniref:Glycosyl transferases group 1 n=1 Tax=Rohdeia mirabilis TaxID=2528008 RepID=A0A518CWL3_9BACT|nr:Glycosyl transferases group 1 [Planctomycetes bacterium Pla163]
MPERAVLGLDYFAAATHAPGIGRYGRELVRAWLRCDDELGSLKLFEAGGRAPRLPDAMLGLDGPDVRRSVERHVRWALPRRATDGFARVLGVERLLGGCDVFLRSRPAAPACRRAASLWPVSQWPGPNDESARIRFASELAANDHLIVFARAAAERLVEQFGVARDRVHVTPVGADHWRRDAEVLDVPTSPRTLLALGAVEDRRWPTALLEAFERLRESGAVERLLLVGRPGTGAGTFERRLGFSSARSHVEWITVPVESDLPRIVSAAAALVHVGQGEATAVTPLEALSFGVPAVVSDVPEMRECLGDRVEYLDADVRDRKRGEALAAAVERALATADDPSARAARRALAERSTWDAVARATSSVVARIAGR